MDRSGLFPEAFTSLEVSCLCFPPIAKCNVIVVVAVAAPVVVVAV